jgi:hypothetical protein
MDKILSTFLHFGCRDSSVGITTSYGLDDESWFSAELRFYFFYVVFISWLGPIEEVSMVWWCWFMKLVTYISLCCTVITVMPSWKLAPRSRSKHEKRTASSKWETSTFPLLTVCCARVGRKINPLSTFENSHSFMYGLYINFRLLERNQCCYYGYQKRKFYNFLSSYALCDFISDSFSLETISSSSQNCYRIARLWP